MKKTRKLIPALAMLLVSVIMMSTASFAWFTMNDVVTATGMNVQAKASGNLLISTQKMSATTTNGVAVTFTDEKQNLFPITLNGGEWCVVDTENYKVDPTYGFTYTVAADGSIEVGEEDDDAYGLIAVDPDNDNPYLYFYQKVVYLATAVEEGYTAPLEVNLDAIIGAGEKVADAYTVAFWVLDGEGDETAWDLANTNDGVLNFEAPDFTYSYNQDKEDEIANKPYATIKDSVDIPSIYGTTSTSAVGLPVVIRIYVDGNMTMGTETIVRNKLQSVATLPTVYNGTYNSTDMANWKFYGSNSEESELDTTDWINGTPLSEYRVNYFWRDTDGTTTVTANAKYVNSANVPTDGTVFSIDFKATDTTNN